MAGEIDAGGEIRGGRLTGPVASGQQQGAPAYCREALDERGDS